MPAIHINSSHHFSFEYPATCQLHDMANNLTVLDHRDTGERVEISLTPFDGLLTVDRVRATLPGLILDHLDVLRTGRDHDIEALTFRAHTQDDPNAAQHVWFVHNSCLYRLTSGPSSQELLEFVIRSWRFDREPPTYTSWDRHPASRP